MIICVIARSMGTFGLIGLLKLCGYESGNPNKLKWSELTFIAFAGLIRGAIAFGLVLRLDQGIENRSVIVTTCLTLVVFTTVVFGSTIGLLSKCLFGSQDDDDDEMADDAISLSNLSSFSQSSKLNTYLEQ